MVIVVGLGNPDAKYQHTNHNVGFDGEGFLDGEKILLVKPQTYMNNSGECVVLLKEKFKSARIIVVADDIDLPKGTVRYRERGSAGTHNGLRSIVAYIGQEFERVRVGIGRDVTKELVDFVLSKYDEQTFAPILQKGANEVLARITKN